MMKETSFLLLFKNIYCVVISKYNNYKSLRYNSLSSMFHSIFSILHESVCLFFNICSFADIDECVRRDVRPDLRDTYPCSGICKNTIGGYDCQCELGMKGDARNGTCKIVFPLIAMVVTFGKIIQ